MNLQRYALYETKPIFTKKEVFKSLFKIVPSTAEIIKIHQGRIKV